MCALQSKSNLTLMCGVVLWGCFWEERPFLVKITLFVVSLLSRDCATKKDVAILCGSVCITKGRMDSNPAMFFLFLFFLFLFPLTLCWCACYFIPDDRALYSHFCNHFLSHSVTLPHSLLLPFLPPSFFTRSTPKKKSMGHFWLNFRHTGWSTVLWKDFMMIVFIR